MVIVGSLLIVLKFGDSKYEVKKQLTSTLNCMINNDYEGVFYYADMMGNVKSRPVIKELPQLTLEKLEYEIENIQIYRSDGYALADVSFSTIDMVELVSKMEEDSTLEDLKRLISDSDYVTKTYSIQLILIKHDNKWYLYETADFADVLTGGLLSLEYNTRSAYMQYLEEENVK